MSTRPRIVIIGAGFGGLWAARALAQADVDIYLLDKNNYHTFLPLLYQVAAAEIEPEQVAYPVRSILRGLPRVHFVMGEVTGIDLATQSVITPERRLTYDYLIVATGSREHFFQVPGAAEHTFPIKTIEQSVALRHRILRSFETAAYETDPERRQRLLTFAIVGGGATGVEYAGALRELIDRPLARDFPTLDPGAIRVVLLEAAPRLLSGMPENLGDYARQRLERMGVEVRLNAPVRQVSEAAIILQSGEAIPTSNVVWTAGVQGAHLTTPWALPAGPGGRVPVLPTLQIAAQEPVYVIGDLAYLEQDGQPLPMLAPVAIQQGNHAAANIMAQLAGRPLRPFVYRDKGVMATIGRNAAVAQLAGRAITGFPAWLIWVVIHLYNLIGFRNRLVVLINWAWDYFFFERVARLILTATPAPTPR